MGFAHIGEIIVLLLLALIVFGPKRLIEMGSQLGKTLRETRDALKEMNWSLTSDEPETPASPASPTGGERERLRIVESAPVNSAPPTDEP
ncbi:MAG TPA: twin-arginine translocase TatA/TatE family subunit [Ktedonobacterales bacterium]|nr:twin-arginine translocase TatA/TatE family subunit [Ktedonobacterales bacterium]